MAFYLVQYAAEGDVKKLKKWIDFGVHVDASNVRKETPLFLCSLNGHIECTEYLLSHGADPNRFVCQRKSLCVFCCRGSYELYGTCEIHQSLGYCVFLGKKSYLMSLCW